MCKKKCIFVPKLTKNIESMTNFVEELRWRGMLHDIMPGTEEQLNKEMTTAYVGIDPTADSLHIGHLCGIMMLRHLQRCGHKPIALLGGATGMIGDPSGKSAERNLLTPEILNHNVACIREQLEHFLDFNGTEPNAAELVNNYDWMKDYTFIDFARNIGKLITVNYMMAKDSVKKRFNGEFSQGMSFTEFTYQLLQGYDYAYLNEHKNCKLQMGGSDQWGNITTGTELIKKMTGKDAFALTCPLITKADGGKFGKTESGNVWLSKKYTSPYKFYQFWLNVSDDDAKKYIKIFTALDKETIEALIAEHEAAPHLRALQKRLAEEVTVMVHSREDYDAAVAASGILFGNASTDALRALDEETFLQVFEGVETFEVALADLQAGVAPLDLLAEKTQIFPSKGEARKMIQANGFSMNKAKLTDAQTPITADALLNGKYLLFQKGKKNYYIVLAK